MLIKATMTYHCAHRLAKIENIQHGQGLKKMNTLILQVVGVETDSFFVEANWTFKYSHCLIPQFYPWEFITRK